MRQKLFATMVVLVACAVALAGCNAEDTPPSASPTSSGQSSLPGTAGTSSTPTPTRSLTPAEQDLRSAQQAITEYWKVIDGAASNPSQNLNVLATVARSQAPGGAQLSGLSRGGAGDLAAVDPVLLEPLVQAAAADAELVGGLLDLLPGPDQRDRARPELGRVGTRHFRSFSVRPSTHHHDWKPTRGQVNLSLQQSRTLSRSRWRLVRRSSTVCRVRLARYSGLPTLFAGTRRAPCVRSMRTLASHERMC